MKKIISSILGSLILSGGIVSCTDMLEEYNPGGGTMDQYAETDNYIAFVNQCYFAMTRYFYGTADGTSSWGHKPCQQDIWLSLKRKRTSGHQRLTS